MPFSRYGVYYLPEPGALAEFGARWLGWDVETGTEEKMFDVADLANVTETPRKYGFHATLKPPFRLAKGYNEADLVARVEQIARNSAPATGGPLTLSQLGRFLALTVRGDSDEISMLAARLVTELDDYRAPLNEDEINKRRPETLAPRQRQNLEKWGYPHVLDCFRFHMTLTGRLNNEQIEHVKSQLDNLLPDLTQPLKINSIAVVGERPDWCFQLIARYALTRRNHD